MRVARKTLLLPALAAVLVANSALANTSTADRSTLEVTSGDGVVTRFETLIQGRGNSYNTRWVDLKIRPFPHRFQMQALGFQIGTHQSDDVSLGLGCRLGSGITQMQVCSEETEQSLPANRIQAIYAGMHAEIVELLTLEPRPLRAYVGAGATTMRSNLAQPISSGYASLELIYRLQKQVSAKAGIFLSHYPAIHTMVAAMPNFSIDYRF